MSVAWDPSEHPHTSGPAGEQPTAPDTVDLRRPAQDPLLFPQARRLLAGPRGGAESTAAQAPPPTNGDARHIVVNLVDAASPSTSDQPQRGSPRAAGRSAARTEPCQAGDPVRFRAWGLIVEGELDLTTGPSLRDAVTKLDWHDPAPGQAGDALLLDLGAVTFIDTRGAHALNDIHAYLAAHGVRLHLTLPTDANPRRLLRYAVTTGWLAPAFSPGTPVHPSVADLGTPAPVRLSVRQTYRRRHA